MPVFPELCHTVKSTVVEQARPRLATYVNIVVGKVALTATTAPSTANSKSTTCKHHILSHYYFTSGKDVLWWPAI